MNRRDFIKKSAIATGALAGTSLLSPIPTFAEGKRGFLKKEHDTIDDVINISKDYKRFDQMNTAFNLSLWSNPNPVTAGFFENGLQDKLIPFPIDGDDEDKEVQANISKYVVQALAGYKAVKPEDKLNAGYTQLDFAYSKAGKALIDGTGSLFSYFSSGDSGPYMPMPTPNGLVKLPMTYYALNRPGDVFKTSEQKYLFDSKHDATYAVKKAAKMFGADLVGIAPFDERWVYKTEVYGGFNAFTQEVDLEAFNKQRPVEFNFKPKSVIVMAIEMDYEAIKTSPSLIANTAAQAGYSKMLKTTYELAVFLKELGYNTVHAGNNLALNVPLAIQAGLGESSRMGLLITEEFGPRVRICKVYTDLELVFDKPKTFGVKKFCEVCFKCADYCPSGAITRVKKTTDDDNKPFNRCNSVGVDKWHNNSQKCLSYWAENYLGCSNCIAVCPYNKIDEWHHDVAEIATKLPGLRNVARYLDEIFGYGKTVNDPKFMADYWKKNI